jgi:chitodextrinase
MSSKEIDLAWSGSTDNVAVTGYVVERCQGTACTPASAINTVSTTTFNDTSRAPSTSYTYQVKARDAANNLSAPSNRVTVLTPASSPDCD